MSDPSPAGPGESGYGPALLVAGVASAILVLMSRTLIDHVPLYDELLHVLAARGLLEHGLPVIADGQYLRALFFTRLVAWSMDWFGDTLSAARLPALAGGVLLLAATSIFTTRRAGWIAGAAAGLVLCAVPLTVELAVFCRFYSVHALLVFLAAVGAYTAIEPHALKAQRGVLALLCVAILLAAYYLQPTAAIASVAMASAVVATLVFDHWREVYVFVRRHPVAVIAGIAALSVLCLLVASVSGLLQALRTAPLWAEESTTKLHYYVGRFSYYMPLIWPLFPLAVLLGLRVQPRLTIFCTAFFLAAVILQSLGAAKASRYAYYALPFLCVVWGCAIAGILRTIAALASHSQGRRTVTLTIPAVLVMGLVLAMSVEGQSMAKLVLGRSTHQEALSHGAEPDWQPLVRILQPLTAAADRVITSNSMKAIYYLGGYDFELNESIVRETDTRVDFGIDPRTGRAAIGTPQSTAQVLDMPGSTLVILEQKTIGQTGGISAAAVSVIQSRCIPVSLPPAAPLSAWRC